MADEILVKQDGPILRVTLNAPDRGNAVTDDMVRALTKLINAAGENADMVVLLNRPDIHDKESDRAGEADIDVAKHRNGPTKTITVAFQGHYSRFTDMQH